jgi:transcription elongation factor Elf1
MPNNSMDAYLFCMNCDKETEHQIDYHDGQIHRITCKECGMAVQINQEYVNTHFKEDFVARVMTKPRRMTEEMQQDLNGFLRTLPHRVITKPYRVYKEWEHEEKKNPKNG